jgi:oxygen-independent coproporphyrinogen III oxidase
MPGLYVHVPFCERKCVYCDFFSTIDGRAPEDRKGFLDACAVEIRLRAGAIGGAEPFTSIFFGGGTPSLLEPREMEALTSALRAHYPIAQDAEFTIECNPGTVDPEKFKGYKSLGANRLSIGVQSFFEEDLRFLSRIHSVSEAEDAIRQARAAGFENISIDLMFSLPGQTPARWLRNLERARDSGVTHMSCYSLTVEEGTSLHAMTAAGGIELPGEDSDADLFRLTMETLESWGYRHYEVSNYALPGFECAHNLGYWRNEDYLGFGPSAHGAWRGRRWWNFSDTDAYCESLLQGKLPVEAGEELTSEIRRLEYMSLRLRSEGIPLEEYRSEFGRDFTADNGAALDRYLKHGLLAIDNGVLKLTPEGFLLCDELCRVLE